MNDPISDMLARIRNAQLVNHETVVMPVSKMKTRVAKILEDEGYIANVETIEDRPQGRLKFALKYDDAGRPVIEGLKRVSRPGMRIYRNAKEIPTVRGGMGMAVVSTSRGVMSDAEARSKNVGGEVLCYVW